MRRPRSLALTGLLTLGCPAGPKDSQEPGQHVTVGPYVAAASDRGLTLMVRVAMPGELECRAWPTGGSAEQPAASAMVQALAEHDLTAHCHLDGLEPATPYAYGFFEDGRQLEGATDRSATTAPPAGEPASFVFGVLADADGKDGVDTPTYAGLAKHFPAFVLQIGDLDHRDPGEAEDLSVEVWRRMHRDQLAEHSQARQLDGALLATTPFLHTWDDHDYGANNADRTAPWRTLAQQAFHEYYPPPPDIPSPQHGIWYSFSWGQVELFMLDVRSQRDPNEAPDGPDKSMLAGEPDVADQYGWLLEGLEDSSATWKILVSGSCFNPHAKQVDSWALFPDEQRSLLDSLVGAGITGVVVLSGDLHSAGGIDDGSFAGLPELSVPTTNLAPPHCTGRDCGSWSHGIEVDEDAAGFALVRVDWDPSIQRHSLTLEAHAADGSLRRSLTLEPQDAVPSGLFPPTDPATVR